MTPEIHLATIVKTTRIARGLTQTTLAQKAGVGFATLQNIEAGRANPEYKTVHAILRALDLSLEIKEATFSWNPLISLGLPLLNTAKITEPNASATLLTTYLNQISKSVLQNANSRELDALAGFLWAIKDHYEYTWQTISPMLREWFRKQSLNGRHIKLRRLSLAGISRYL